MISPGIKAAPKMCSIKPYYSISFPGIKAASPKCVQLNPITLSVFLALKLLPQNVINKTLLLYQFSLALKLIE